VSDAPKLKPGDKFTISGVGYDKDGWLVINGHRADGKKSAAVKDQVWAVGSNGEVQTQLPARKVAMRRNRKA
jgi:hypothetical protein